MATSAELIGRLPVTTLTHLGYRNIHGRLLGFLIGALSSYCFILPLAAAVADTSSPSLVCESPSRDVGLRWDYEIIDCSFIIGNRSDRAVTITDVRASCGCVVSSLSRKTLAPGETSQLSLKVSLDGADGAIKREIAVMIGEQHFNALTLTVAANVRQAITISPRRIVLPRMSESDVASASATITVHDPALKLRIQKMKCTSPQLSARCIEAEPMKRFQVDISASPPFTGGFLDGEVHVVTDNTRHPIVIIPVNGMVARPVSIIPSRLRLREGHDNAVIRYINVGPGTVKKFRVLNVEVPVASVNAEIILKGNEGYLIRLENLVATSSLHGKFIRIITDLPNSELQVPIEVITLSSDKTEGGQGGQ